MTNPFGLAIASACFTPAKHTPEPYAVPDLLQCLPSEKGLFRAEKIFRTEIGSEA